MTDAIRIRPPAALLLALSYPLLAHLAIVSGSPWALAGSVGWLLVLVLLPALSRARAWAWVALATSVGLLFLAVRHGAATLPSFVPPVLITGLMAWLFGRSLHAQRVPFIEMIIRALHGPDDPLTPEILTYARSLTAGWTVLFTTLMTVNLALALFATPGGVFEVLGAHAAASVPLEAWSLFANILNYVVIGAMFVVEYAYRRHRFPHQDYRSFGDFIHRLIKLGPLVSLDPPVHSDRARVDSGDVLP